MPPLPQRYFLPEAGPAAEANDTHARAAVTKFWKCIEKGVKAEQKEEKTAKVTGNETQRL